MCFQNLNMKWGLLSALAGLFIFLKISFHQLQFSFVIWQQLKMCCKIKCLSQDAELWKIDNFVSRFKDVLLNSDWRRARQPHKVSVQTYTVSVCREPGPSLNPGPKSSTCKWPTCAWRISACLICRFTVNVRNCLISQILIVPFLIKNFPR